MFEDSIRGKFLSVISEQHAIQGARVHGQTTPNMKLHYAVRYVERCTSLQWVVLVHIIYTGLVFVCNVIIIICIQS